MDNTAVVSRWHRAILQDCAVTLGRNPTPLERAFVVSRRGLIALEAIHDRVKNLAGDRSGLERYLRSEDSNRNS
ncbi:MAG: hypothetical protein ACHQ5A_04010 [Opitutales bacterium]